MPRSFFSYNTCRGCMNKGVVIRIEMGIWGAAAYLFSFLSLALIVARLANYDLGIGSSDVYLIFGLIAAGFVCQFVEVGRAQKLAHQRISEHYPKHRQ